MNTKNVRSLYSFLFFIVCSLFLFLSCSKKNSDNISENLDDISVSSDKVTLQGFQKNENFITLAWERPGDNEYFIIYRSEGSSDNFKEIARVVETNYTDLAFSIGNIYYKVESCDNSDTCTQDGYVLGPINMGFSEYDTVTVRFYISLLLDSSIISSFSNQSKVKVYGLLYNDQDILVGKIDTVVGELSQGVTFKQKDSVLEDLFVFSGNYSLSLYIDNDTVSTFGTGAHFIEKNISVERDNLDIIIDTLGTTLKALNFRVYIADQLNGETEQLTEDQIDTVRNQYLRIHCMFTDETISKSFNFSGEINSYSYADIDTFHSATDTAVPGLVGIPEGSYIFTCWLDRNHNGRYDSDFEEFVTEFSVSENTSRELDLGNSSNLVKRNEFIYVQLTPQWPTTTFEISFSERGVDIGFDQVLFVDTYKLYRNDSSEVIIEIEDGAVTEGIVHLTDSTINLKDATENETDLEYTYKVEICYREIGEDGNETLQCIKSDGRNIAELNVTIPYYGKNFSIIPEVSSFMTRVRPSSTDAFSLTVDLSFLGDQFISTYTLFDVINNRSFLDNISRDELNFIILPSLGDNNFKVTHCTSLSGGICFPLNDDEPITLSLDISYLVHPVLQNFRAGDQNPLLKELISYQDSLFFRASTDLYGTELWKYSPTNYNVVDENEVTLCNNSTSSNPCLVQDLESSSIIEGTSGNSIPSALYATNDTLYLSAFTREIGEEFYKYTNSTIDLVSDIATGDLLFVLGSSIPYESTPRDFIQIGDKVYFHAFTKSEGRELFIYDTISETTELLADLFYLATSSSPHDLVEVNGVLYFVAEGQVLDGGVLRKNIGDHLWKYDPSLRTTFAFDYCGNNIIEDLEGVPSNPCAVKGGADTITQPTDIRLSTVVDDTIYFIGKTEESGQELWSYKITSNSLQLKMDLFSGVESSYVPAISEMVYYENDNTLYFTATNGTHGIEIWKYDLNTIVSNNNFSECQSILATNPCYIDIRSDNSLFFSPKYLKIYENFLVFQGDYGVYGAEVWLFNLDVDISFDNTEYSPFCSLTNGYNPCLLADIYDGIYSSFPNNFTIIGNKIYFTAYNDREMWAISFFEE